jgi:hypothetical protein
MTSARFSQPWVTQEVKYQEGKRKAFGKHEEQEKLKTLRLNIYN